MADTYKINNTVVIDANTDFVGRAGTYSANIAVGGTTRLTGTQVVTNNIITNTITISGGGTGTFGAINSNQIALTGLSNNQPAIFGQANSGIGVQGISTTFGTGVYGASNTGIGVIAVSTSGSALNASAQSGYAIFAAGDSAHAGNFGSNTGVGLISASNTNYGLLVSSRDNVAVWATSTLNLAIRGESTSNTQNSHGVQGISKAGYGVVGQTASANGTWGGVIGLSPGSTFYGILGRADGYGVVCQGKLNVSANVEIGGSIILGSMTLSSSGISTTGSLAVGSMVVNGTYTQGGLSIAPSGAATHTGSAVIIAGGSGGGFSTSGWTKAITLPGQGYILHFSRNGGSLGWSIGNSGDNLYFGVAASDDSSQPISYPLRLSTAGAFIHGATVWHSNNDGAGSGLDADLLDGQDSSFYTNIPARLGYSPVSRGGDTMTGDLTVTRGNSTGYVWFGNTGTRYIGFDGTNTVIPGSTVVTGVLTAQSNFAASGSVQAVGGVFYYNNGGIYSTWDGGGISFTHRLFAGGGLVWTSVNDGPGSGLDADLLDSQDSSFYTNIPARLGYTPVNPNGVTTLNGDLTVNRAVYGVPDQGIIWFGNAGGNYIHYTPGNFGFTNNISCPNIFAPSDIRLKKDILPISNALEVLDAWNPVSFKKIDDETETTQYGFIAQELAGVNPELVKDTVLEVDSEDRYKTVNYVGTIGLLTAAIKELKAEVELLKKV